MVEFGVHVIGPDSIDSKLLQYCQSSYDAIDAVPCERVYLREPQ